MEGEKSYSQKLADRRENFRVKIRKEKWRRTIEQQRRRNLEESDLQMMRDMFNGEQSSIDRLLKSIATATVPVVEKLQEQLVGEILERLHELRSDDLATLGLLQLKSKSIAEPVLSRLLKMLMDINGRTLSERYINSCLGYLAVCARLLTQQRQPRQLLEIFILFMSWWDNGCPFRSQHLYRFLAAIYTFCSIEADLFSNYMIILRYLINTQGNSTLLPRSLLYLILLVVEDQEDEDPANEQRRLAARNKQQMYIDALVEDSVCVNRVLKALEYEPALAIRVLNSLSMNKTYQLRLFKSDIEQDWLEKCCQLVSETNSTCFVLAILANFAQHSEVAKRISTNVKFIESITRQQIVEEYKMQVAQLYVRLVEHGNPEERLELLQKFDVLSFIIKEVDWDEAHLELAKDCLEIMRLITDSQRVPGIVRDLFEQAEAKAIGIQTLGEDLEPQLEIIRRSIKPQSCFE